MSQSTRLRVILGIIRSRRRALSILVMTLALLLIGCSPDPPSIEIDKPDGTKLATVRVEIANTEGQREFGLMYRNKLDENAGMIFVFQDTAPRHFWMKNTPIFLDMIFADEDGTVVGIVQYAEPYSETPVGPEAPAHYVLEVNGGFAGRHHIAAGDRLKFIGFRPHARD